MYLWKTKSEVPPLSKQWAWCNYHKPGFVYLGLLFLAGTKFSFLTTISQRPDLRVHVRDFDVHNNETGEQQRRLFTFPFPYPLKNNFPLHDLHCVTTIRIQHYVGCNKCVVPLLKASIRSTAPQTEQNSQSTELLDKMPQCRKMSNVLQRRLVTVHRLTGSFIGRYKYKITTVKWPLNLSSTANEVRAFGNVYSCTSSGLI